MAFGTARVVRMQALQVEGAWGSPLGWGFWAVRGGGELETVAERSFIINAPYSRAFVSRRFEYPFRATSGIPGQLNPGRGFRLVFVRGKNDTYKLAAPC